MPEASDSPVDSDLDVVAGSETKLDGDELIAGWLTEVECVADIVRVCAEAQRHLKNKRVTLEEKMICRNLNELASVYGSLLHLIHNALIDSTAVQEAAAADGAGAGQADDSVIASFRAGATYHDDIAPTVTEQQARSLDYAYASCAGERQCAALTAYNLANLHAINLEIEPVMLDLLHKITYNLNYLEQYYEHDFLARLLDKYKFVERLQSYRKAALLVRI